MNNFRHHGELKKYEEVDEDELLATLSPAELQEELLNLYNNVPIGMRQKDQTTNSPVEPSDERMLLKRCEDENQRLHEDDGVKSKKEQVRGRCSKHIVPHLTSFHFLPAIFLIGSQFGQRSAFRIRILY